VNHIDIPEGYYLSPGYCRCGARLVEEDQLEGLPIYACPYPCQYSMKGLEEMNQRRRKKPGLHTSQVPMNLEGVVHAEIEELIVGSWCPLPEGQGPATQVHMMIKSDIISVPQVMRFKSRASITQVIEALSLHRDDVWPEAPQDPHA
jgi:hypothetical protein